MKIKLLEWSGSQGPLHCTKTAVGNIVIYEKQRNEFRIYRTVPLAEGVSLKYSYPGYTTLEGAKAFVNKLHKDFLATFIIEDKKCSKSATKSARKKKPS